MKGCNTVFPHNKQHTNYRFDLFSLSVLQRVMGFGEGERLKANKKYTGFFKCGH